MSHSIGHRPLPSTQFDHLANKYVLQNARVILDLEWIPTHNYLWEQQKYSYSWGWLKGNLDTFQRAQKPLCTTLTLVLHPAVSTLRLGEHYDNSLFGDTQVHHYVWDTISPDLNQHDWGDKVYHWQENCYTSFFKINRLWLKYCSWDCWHHSECFEEYQIMSISSVYVLPLIIFPIVVVHVCCLFRLLLGMLSPIHMTSFDRFLIYFLWSSWLAKLLLVFGMVGL